MKKYILKPFFATVVASLFVFTSCVDERYDLENIDSTVALDMTFVGPIGKSTIKLSDMLPDSLDGFTLLIENDSVFVVLYDTVNFGSTFIDDIKIPKGQFTKHIPVIDANLAPTTSVDVDVTMQYEFDINTNPNERIDSILFKSSQIDFSFTSNYDFAPEALMELIFDPTQLLLDATLYPENKIQFQLTQGTIEQDIDLTGAKLYFPTASRILDIRFKANVVTSTPFVPGSEEIDVVVDFDTALPRIVYGYIGQDRDIWGGDIVREFDFTSAFQGARVFLPFHNPRLFITAESNIGIPAQYTLDYVKATDTNTSEVVYADFNGSPNTSFVLNYPVYSEIENKTAQELLSFDSRTLDKRDTKLFDRGYGATNRLFQINANELAYKFTVKTVADPAAPVHYFFDDSQMSLYIKAKLQLNFDGNDTPNKNFFIGLKDTIDFCLGDQIDLDDDATDVAAQIKLEYKNALPIGAEVLLYFLDANGQEVKFENVPLRKEYSIQPAQVKPDGTVLRPQPNTNIVVQLSKTEARNYLSKARRLAFDYTMQGAEGENVQLKASDWLEMKASFYVKGKVKLNQE